jgi:hypothetical protein
MLALIVRFWAKLIIVFELVSRHKLKDGMLNDGDGFRAIQEFRTISVNRITNYSSKPITDPLLLLFFQFDSYLRSLKIDQNNICLVTDGQLPLRQCLHPEAGAKEIQLPSYLWKFSDLKREYVHSKSGDLSRALIPINDVSKLPNMPALPPAPATIADILNGRLSLRFGFESKHEVEWRASSSTTTTIRRIGWQLHATRRNMRCEHVWVTCFLVLPGSHNSYYSNDPQSDPLTIITNLRLSYIWPKRSPVQAESFGAKLSE